MRVKKIKTHTLHTYTFLSESCLNKNIINHAYMIYDRKLSVVYVCIYSLIFSVFSFLQNAILVNLLGGHGRHGCPSGKPVL